MRLNSASNCGTAGTTGMTGTSAASDDECTTLLSFDCAVLESALWFLDLFFDADVTGDGAGAAVAVLDGVVVVVVVVVVEVGGAMRCGGFGSEICIVGVPVLFSADLNNAISFSSGAPLIGWRLAEVAWK